MKQRLKKAKDGEITKEDALFFLNEGKTSDRLLELFKIASKVRDDEIGNVFKFDGFIGPITPCTTSPPCNYCGRSSKNWFSNPLTPEEVALSARLVEKTGIRRVELGGGTLWSGADSIVLKAVKAVKSEAKLGIWVNVGPCLSREALRELKNLGVIEVGSSLETINEAVFKEAKPGDSFETRTNFARAIKQVGLGLTSVMMVGIGSSYQDYVEHIFWLKEIGVNHFCITGFNPIPGTPFEGRMPAFSCDVAKVIAISRLLLRGTDISVGGIMNDPQLLPIAVMAGANRAIHLGAHAHRAGSWHVRQGYIQTKKFNGVEFVNWLPRTVRIVKEMGMRVEDAIEQSLGAD